MPALDELKRFDANGQMEVRVDAIRQSKVALRDVNRQKPEFLQLAESVATKGVYTPIQVRVITDPETGDPAFGLIDGLQRWTASKDAGKEWIPATIKSMEDADILDAQLISNLHRVQTTPQQYTEHLLRILAANPLMTERDLAKRLSVSDTFIAQRLSLSKLIDKAMKLVNENVIPMLNGYSLAKLPPEEQEEFLDRAQTDQPTVFGPAVAARVKELRDAKAQGRETKPSEFVLTPHLQKVKEVFEESRTPKVGPALLAKAGVTDVVSAWQLALAWVTKTDADSEAAARATYEAKKQKREEEKERAKKEREEKKNAEAAQRAYA